MKKIILIAFLIVTTTSIFAQPPHRKENLEQLKAQKVAFITQKLSLTPQEAQNFWPVYNEYEKKRDAFQHKRRELMKKCKQNSETLTDAEYEQIALQFVALPNEMSKLLEEYHLKFKKILPIKKVVLLYQIEHDFKRELLKRIGEDSPGVR